MNADDRVLSGMRPTGRLHLGHYHGVLRNWVQLQHQKRCFFFAADWHALTTEYENPQQVAAHTQDMIVDWLAAGVLVGLASAGGLLAGVVGFLRELPQLLEQGACRRVVVLGQPGRTTRPL